MWILTFGECNKKSLCFYKSFHWVEVEEMQVWFPTLSPISCLIFQRLTLFKLQCPGSGDNTALFPYELQIFSTVLGKEEAIQFKELFLLPSKSSVKFPPLQ